MIWIFKKFNDTYGHLAGDDCLKAVSKCVQIYHQNSCDLVARYGGEEFCVLLVQKSKDEAYQIAEEIRRAVSELKIPHETSPIDDYVTVSIGVATVRPEWGMEPEDLIEMADEALYQSKKKGRNRVTVYDNYY